MVDPIPADKYTTLGGREARYHLILWEAHNSMPWIVSDMLTGQPCLTNLWDPPL
jgi:hypothetical protein